MTVNDAGDLIGNGKRVRGMVKLNELVNAADLTDESGSVTATKLRVYASGAANAKLTVYGLSLVNARSEKTVSLMNAETLQVNDRTKKGGYTYENGRLTVRAEEAGYAVSFALQETYNVEWLRNLLFKADATATFDITLTASTSADDVTFGLAADFWPDLCDAKDNGYLPSGQYEKAVNLYSAYTYNGLAPADGMSTVRTVTVTLGSTGELVLEALQLSTDTAVTAMADGMTAADTTPDQKGDVNGDGAINTMDVRRILQFTIDGDLTPEQQAVADVNGDGAANTMDCREILRSLLVA